MFINKADRKFIITVENDTQVNRNRKYELEIKCKHKRCTLLYCSNIIIMPPSSHTYRRLLVCNYTIAYILYSISCLACNNALSILTMILPKCLSVLYRCYAYCDAHLLHFVLGRDDSRFNISLYTNVLMFHSPSDGE